MTSANCAENSVEFCLTMQRSRYIKLSLCLPTDRALQAYGTSHPLRDPKWPKPEVNKMTMPGFTGESALYVRRGRYALSERPARSHANAVVPAIPRCENCEDLLDFCAEHNWRPRAACNACAIGHCSSGVEVPPQALQGGGGFGWL